MSETRKAYYSYENGGHRVMADDEIGRYTIADCDNEATAVHIAACWNACIGIHHDVLIGAAKHGVDPMLETIEEQRVQIAEMRLAIEQMYIRATGWPGTAFREIASIGKVILKKYP